VSTAAIGFYVFAPLEIITHKLYSLDYQRRISKKRGKNFLAKFGSSWLFLIPSLKLVERFAHTSFRSRKKSQVFAIKKGAGFVDLQSFEHFDAIKKYLLKLLVFLHALTVFRAQNSDQM
jgi:hypothetical protein